MNEFIKRYVRDFGKAVLISAVLAAPIISRQLYDNYEKFGRLLSLSKVNLPVEKVEGSNLVSKIGLHWDNDGVIDEIIATYEDAEKKQVKSSSYPEGSVYHKRHPGKNGFGVEVK